MVNFATRSDVDGSTPQRRARIAKCSALALLTAVNFSWVQRAELVPPDAGDSCNQESPTLWNFGIITPARPSFAP